MYPRSWKRKTSQGVGCLLMLAFFPLTCAAFLALMTSLGPVVYVALAVAVLVLAHRVIFRWLGR